MGTKVQEGQDAGLAGGDDEVTKTREGQGSGASAVDGCGYTWIWKGKCHLYLNFNIVETEKCSQVVFYVQNFLNASNLTPISQTQIISMICAEMDHIFYVEKITFVIAQVIVDI